MISMTNELTLGLTVSSEEHPPHRLVEIARLAEESGFDFLAISDHYHPWVTAQGHSPFVWSVLGAISKATTEIDVAVGVTCPTTRLHPAILAQSVATTGMFLKGRFAWGVGTGEALNEHVVGSPPGSTTSTFTRSGRTRRASSISGRRKFSMRYFLCSLP